MDTIAYNFYLSLLNLSTYPKSPFRQARFISSADRISTSNSTTLRMAHSHSAQNSGPKLVVISFGIL